MVAWPVVCAEPPVIPVVIVGADQVYVVPVGTPVGVTLKAVPEQAVAVWFVTAGLGLTITVATFEVCERHPLDDDTTTLT